MMRVLVVAVTVLLLASCSSGGGGGKGHSKSDDAFLACSHFRNVAGDASKGLLTDSELRGKLKEVYSDAVIAPPAVRRAAQDMLAAATAGSFSRLKRATSKMDDACHRLGQ